MTKPAQPHPVDERPLPRILHVTPSYAPAYRYGGPVRSVEGLATHLARAGARVRVLTTDADGDATLQEPRGWHRRDAVDVCYEPRHLAPDIALGLPFSALEAARDADIVHVNALFSVPSLVGLLTALGAGVAVMLSPRGALERPALERGHSLGKRAWLAALRPWLARTTYHATSEQEAHAIRQVFGGRARVCVIPNGTDIETQAAASERRAAQRSHRFVIGMAGRIHPIKGIHRVINAVAELRRQSLDVELRLAGPTADAAYHDELRALVAARGLEDAVSFEGALDGAAKLDFYAACDVLCLASDSENFGNVVIESLAACTPVIAARTTPWRLLVDEDAGAWVDPTPDAFAAAISALIAEPAAVTRQGRNGRRVVERDFTWDSVARRFLGVYVELFERTRNHHGADP